ncbi:uncharacterized protein [Rutidosis leptorrhynchoides]|uniref:uncharacterized protein n=1 Tax=Rutidosis leptorrhynchoides TaxID=125765 RepID=UPI003A98DF0B
MLPKKFTQADVRRWITEGLTEAVAELPNGTNSNKTTNTGGCTYKTFLSCEPHSFNGTEGLVGLTHWFEKLESVFRISGCRDADRMKFASCKLSDGALTWWNTYAKSVRMDQAFETSWEDLKQRTIEEYYPYNEIVKMERELPNLKLVGTDLASYNKRLFELALMCPNMVTHERHKITLYVKGLTENIQGGVTTSKPRTVQDAVEMVHELMDQIPERVKVPAATKTKTLSRWHHLGDCIKKCDKCKKNGHLAVECKAGSNMCYGCEKDGHFRKDCPTAKNLYSIELGNCNLIRADKVYRDCTLILAGTFFRIDVIPIQLGTFDLVVGMDWLAENRADIFCHQKAIHIPVIEDEPSMVYGVRSNTPLHFINCLKVQKHIRKGFLAILVHVSKTKSEGKKLEDVPIVREFLDVFWTSYPDYLRIEM